MVLKMGGSSHARAVYLASDEADSVVGTCMAVEGGMTARCKEIGLSKTVAGVVAPLVVGEPLKSFNRRYGGGFLT